VLAFAGIGNPDKFFASVADAGLSLGATQAFADHHRYSAEDAGDLIMRAEHNGWALITTEKDHARMTGEPALAALAQRAHVLPVAMQIEEMAELQAALAKVRRP
jgi:tetraacyldisaccharide 4'-kinase